MSSPDTAPPSTSDSTAQPSVVNTKFAESCTPDCLDFLNMPVQDRMAMLQTEEGKTFLQKCEADCSK